MKFEATYEIRVQGIVQGVGFRPFVFILATQLDISGFVQNLYGGVRIIVQCAPALLLKFIYQIQSQKPQAAYIESLEWTEWESTESFQKFYIRESISLAENPGFISPDHAICEQCIQEIFDNNSRRFQYPFTTCATCGPRFGILKNLPFDRQNTSMDLFPMCEKCSDEYQNPQNRRFHAQTISCEDCGPKLTMYANDQKVYSSDNQRIVKSVVKNLKEGKIVAVKGMGGFLLLCDANNVKTVQTLRSRKQRPSKPFAVLMPNDLLVDDFFVCSAAERAALQSKIAPIVLLKFKESLKQKIGLQWVAPKLRKIGVMRPSTALLAIISKEFDGFLVATSANVSGSPIIFEDENVFQYFNHIADIIVTDNRPLSLGQDDSVFQFAGTQRIILRRGRGMAPYIGTKNAHNQLETIALGAAMKSTFSISKQNTWFVSQFLGDSEIYESQNNFTKNLKHLRQILRIKKPVFLSDMHPQYFSTQLGENFGAMKIQHHQAHFSAILAEHQLFSQTVLGVIWDGTGWFDENTICGGEFFRYEKQVMYRCHIFKPFEHILGDKMVKEPRLSALSLMAERGDVLQNKFTLKEFDFYRKYLKNNSKKIKSHAVGRVFDAVACMLGLCDVQYFEGEAALYLENLAQSFPFPEVVCWRMSYLPKLKKAETIDTHRLLFEIYCDFEKGLALEEIAYKFHLTLVDAIRQVAQQQQLVHIAFSGGVFQNGLLVKMLQNFLVPEYFLYFHQELSPNDENISFGQIIYFQNLINQNCMCLAIPGKIQSIEYRYDGRVRMAKISFGGIIKEASLEMLPQAQEGDYVLVHVGVAISIINEEEAAKSFEYLKEIGEIDELIEHSQVEKKNDNDFNTKI